MSPPPSALLAETARRFEANRVALAQRQPEWDAKLVAAADRPDAFEIARDGLLSARTVDGEGRRRWLGSTSMPSISTAALLDDFTDLGGNVALPDVGSGYEIAAYLERLPPHTAVFVCTDSAERLRLALSLYDYTRWIAEGRLVMVDPAEGGAGLARFFATHVGYEFPGRMVRLPHVAPAEFARVQAVMEQGGAAACVAQNRAVQSSVERIALAVGAEPSPRPVVAVISVDPRPDTSFPAEQIGRELAAMGWGGVTCLPTRPDRCHTAARLSAIADAGADVVLCVNCGPGHMSALLPATVRIACWFQPEAAPGTVRAAAETPVRLFVSTPRQRDEAVAAGAVADRVFLLEPPIPGEISAERREPDSGAAPPRRYDVGLVVGLHDDRPAAANVVLSSHVGLYEAIRGHCRREFRRYQEAHAPALVELGQRTARVELTDAALREQFVALVRGRIGPAATALGLARGLRERGISVGVWGHTGGVFTAEADSGRDGATPLVPLEGPLAWASLDAPVTRSRVLLIPTRMPIDIRLLLLAARAGVPVLALRPAARLEDVHPQLAPALTHVTWFDTPGEALDRVGALLGASSEAPAGLMTGGALVRPSESVLGEHSLRRRLEQLVAALPGA